MAEQTFPMNLRVFDQYVSKSLERGELASVVIKGVQSGLLRSPEADRTNNPQVRLEDMQHLLLRDYLLTVARNSRSLGILFVSFPDVNHFLTYLVQNISLVRMLSS
jgi:hypothetical protein